VTASLCHSISLFSDKVQLPNFLVDSGSEAALWVGGGGRPQHLDTGKLRDSKVAENCFRRIELSAVWRNSGQALHIW
jgi:hypothetical protein